jgi:type VI secretion system protein ImpJ
MTRVSDVPDPVQWHEGMLLAPQHFQQLALRGDALLQYHMLAAAPFHWGVRQLRIDTSLLLDGTFRVIELEAVMPDGLSVSYRDGDPIDLSVSLAGKPMDRNASVAVHLAVPAARGSATAAGHFSRYSSYDGSPVADLNTGEGELPVPRLRPRISLIVGDTPPDKFVSIPLARVTYRDERYALADFVPPLLQVTTQDELGKMSAHVLKRIREKAVFLADRARAASATAKRPLVLETQLMAQNLSCALPPVEAMLRTGVTHPYPLFVGFCGIVGHVAAVGTALVPPVVDAYDHLNLYACFESMFSYIDGVLDGIQEAYRPVPFRLSNGTFELALDPEWLQGGSLVLGAVGPAGVSDAELAAWLESSLIASKTKMTSLRERRVRGPARSRVDSPDSLGVAPRRGEVIVTVGTDAQYVEAGEVLQVLNPGDAERGRPDEVVLYVATRA